jgi:hypothetical protein
MRNRYGWVGKGDAQREGFTASQGLERGEVESVRETVDVAASIRMAEQENGRTVSKFSMQGKVCYPAGTGRPGSVSWPAATDPNRTLSIGGLVSVPRIAPPVELLHPQCDFPE